MNIFKLILVLSSLFLLGCNNSVEHKEDVLSGSRTNTNDSIDIKKAQKNMQVAMQALFKINNQTLSKTNSQKIQQKSGSQNCLDGGNFLYDVSVKNNVQTTVMFFKQCKVNETYIDGTIVFKSDNDTYTKTMKLLGFNFKNEAMDFYTNSFVAEENPVEFWAKKDGEITVNTKCFTEQFKIKTLEKMYETHDSTTNIAKGKMELNGAIYTYANPDVTIEVGDTVETMLQSELNTETETCEES